MPKKAKDQESKILSETQLTFIRSIEKEYRAGFDLLNSINRKTVTVYGSSRMPETDENYKDIRKIGRSLRGKGWGVVTGGGPGVMTAALDDDITEKIVDTIALNIDLETEMIKACAEASMTFSHFSVRKYLLRQSDAFLIAPGGYGTMDEMMELLTLIQTNKYSRVPVVLYKKAFWEGLVNWFKDTLLKEGMIPDGALNIFTFAETPEEAVKKLMGKDFDKSVSLGENYSS